ncbi:hypothetical protein [Citrobacter portucalensis]|uniref:hypothetical protein n=1 Tax=Citrobacter portucalensis TaxID=1639133 RepID=UPI00292C1EDA|nr:hypothetical protein [Citrobacter portucalensis]MDV0515658.1 hypothetical protein [Citrobacter portucalensis]MDV0520863.1 hypothetical protein [Citrobacter portucalensis]MDV0566354.1 hypothetical protein [Citrobacter portucalensis]MEB0754294.1 hypothetical protein [Citrobacter portucalensis]MEB0764779.1 hypothetical protein [Citrobacter portucalensis]
MKREEVKLTLFRKKKGMPILLIMKKGKQVIGLLLAACLGYVGEAWCWVFVFFLFYFRTNDVIVHDGLK